MDLALIGLHWEFLRIQLNFSILLVVIFLTGQIFQLVCYTIYSRFVTLSIQGFICKNRRTYKSITVIKICCMWIILHISRNYEDASRCKQFWIISMAEEMKTIRNWCAISNNYTMCKNCSIKYSS